jgi:alcohol dehydrogenase
MLLPVPPELDSVTATLFNPLGAGIRWGVTVPETQPGAIVAVLGPGIRGLSVCAAVKHAGAGFVMVTGRGDRDAPRLAAAREFGADLVVDVERMDPVGALREAVGGLADVVVDVTAKAPAAFVQAIRLARAGGTIVVAGTRGSRDIPGFDPDLLVYKELRIVGRSASARRHIAQRSTCCDEAVSVRSCAARRTSHRCRCSATWPAGRRRQCAVFVPH